MALYSAMHVHKYANAMVPHGATCGACTTTFKTWVQSEQVCA